MGSGCLVNIYTGHARGPEPRQIQEVVKHKTRAHLGPVPLPALQVPIHIHYIRTQAAEGNIYFHTPPPPSWSHRIHDLQGAVLLYTIQGVFTNFDFNLYF